jgi:hypothetical protein
LTLFSTILSELSCDCLPCMKNIEHTENHPVWRQKVVYIKFCKLVEAHGSFYFSRFIKLRRRGPPRMGSKLLARGGPERRPCQAEPQFLVFLEKVHNKIAAGLQPVLMCLRRQSPDKCRQLASFGKNRTNRIHRLTSSLKRSSMLVDFRCLWCCRGSW